MIVRFRPLVIGKVIVRFRPTVIVIMIVRFRPIMIVIAKFYSRAIVKWARDLFSCQTKLKLS